MRFQRCKEKLHSMKRWVMVSEASRQKGHLEGPWMPRLRRFSAVRIFPWTNSQQKVLILGNEGSDHTSFQILEGGGEGGPGVSERRWIYPSLTEKYLPPQLRESGVDRLRGAQPARLLKKTGRRGVRISGGLGGFQFSHSPSLFQRHKS
jgi:hypothetical protein